MGVGGGVWECGKPERFSIISMPQSEGGKGEVTFSLRPPRWVPPFPLSPRVFVGRMYERRCKEWTDQQAALEQLRELYREKNEHLEKFLEPVEPYEFYREIFPEGSFERKGHFEDRKGNGIAVTVPKGEVDKATGIALQIEGGR